MTVALLLVRAQRAAEALMVDTCSVKRPNGVAYDDASQAEVPAFTALFSSRCKVQASGLSAAAAEVGGRTATEVRLRVDLPVSTAALRVGDVITVTPSDDSTSAAVAYVVTAPFEGTHKTARRYAVERYT